MKAITSCVLAALTIIPISAISDDKPEDPIVTVHGTRIAPCAAGAIRIVSGSSYGCLSLSSLLNFNSYFSLDSGGFAGVGSSGTETSDPDSDPKDKCKGNPIMVGSGNKIQYETDYIGKGEFPLRIERNYSHFSEHEDFFGEHWISNFGSYLTINSAAIEAYRADGRVLTLTKINPNSDVWFDRRGSASMNKVIENPDGSYTFETEYDFVEEYDATGKLKSVTNPEGITHTYTYQGNKLHQITHSSGDALTFTWNGQQLTRVTDVAGNHYNYSYNNNMLSQVVRPGSPQVTKDYLYQNASHPKALTQIDINGDKYATFTYHIDGKGKSTNHWVTTENPLAPPTESEVDKFEFDFSTNHTTVTNPLGHEERYIYSNVNGVRKITAVQRMTAPNCPVANSGTTYDSNGLLKTTTDWEGIVTEHNYNASGQLLSQVYAKNTPEQKTVTYTWVAGENRIQSKTTSDLETTYSYTNSGRIDLITSKNISSFGTPNEVRAVDYSYTNHANGIMATMVVDGPRTDVSDITTLEYDISGNLTKVKNALGHETLYSNYDALGNPRRVTSPNGLITDFTYDAGSKVITQKTHHPAGIQTTSFIYNAKGLPTKVTYPNGNFLEYEYDQAYRLVQVNDRYDGYIKFELNENGNTVSRKIGEEGVTWQSPPHCWGGGKDSPVAGGGSVDDCQPVPTPYHNRAFAQYYDYDVMGRLQKTIGNGGQVTDLDYDLNSNIKEVMDSYGRKTIHTYDNLNRIKTVTDAKNGVTTYSYDSGGRMNTVTDARGLTTTYNYSGFGELEALVSPDAGTTTYDYNQSGQVTKITRHDGSVSMITYDALGRIKTENSAGSIKTYRYDYTPGSTENRIGRLWDIVWDNGNSYLVYWYDKVGNVTRKAEHIDGITYNNYYTYDGMNRIKNITYPSGRQAQYNYDPMGRVSNVRYLNGSNNSLVASQLKYRPFGPLYRMKHGNNAVREITHDLDYRSKKIFTSGIQSLDYTFDKNDNITRITNGYNSSSSQAYSYDELNRLIAANASATGSMSYVYDEVGNRTQRKKNGVVQETNTYASNSNRLVDVNGSAITYNANGQTKIKNGATFNYDAQNRLTSHVKNGVTTQFKHNGLGQRVKKSGGITGTNYFFYDEAGQLIAEKNGNTWKEYIYLHNQVIGFAKNGNLYYVHNDHLGRSERITNVSKTTVWKANNNDFDRVVTTNSVGGYSLGFPGQYYDQETELYYNYFRDYDPSAGRYIQSDPIGLQGGVNTYAYVYGNPVILVDPYGLAPPARGSALCGALQDIANNPNNQWTQGNGDFSFNALGTEQLPGGQTVFDGVDIQYVQTSYAFSNSGGPVGRQFAGLGSIIGHSLYSIVFGMGGSGSSLDETATDMRGTLLGNEISLHGDFKDFVDTHCGCKKND